MPRPLNLAVFVSGSGTNLQAILDAGIENVNVALVVSNNPRAYAIERARRRGVPVRVVEHKRYPSRESYDARLVELLEEFGIDLIALAGFMRILSPFMVNRYRNKIMNIHPALLPSFPGTNAVARALEYGVKWTGCTVHFLDEGVDTGPIIIQSAVPVYDGDTVESLAERIHQQEHRIYPEAIRLFAEGRLTVKGRRVFVG
jgi:phosphoribosylglycinamide formyltransferase-1